MEKGIEKKEGKLIWQFVKLHSKEMSNDSNLHILKVYEIGKVTKTYSSP